jgi:hypothetical protein
MIFNLHWPASQLVNTSNMHMAKIFTLTFHYPDLSMAYVFQVKEAG